MNLNADMVDGYHASAFLLLSGGTMIGSLTMNDNTRILGTNVIDSLVIRTDAVGSDEIIANSIAAVDIADNAVGTAEIADGSIADADIAASANIAGSKINPVFDRLTVNGDILLSGGNSLSSYNGYDGSLRLRARGSTHFFIDNDNNSAGETFGIYHNNAAHFFPLTPLFTVNESGAADLYGAAHFWKTGGDLWPQISSTLNPDNRFNGDTLHEGVLASKGGFWAAQTKHYAANGGGYDAIRVGARAYDVGAMQNSCMTVEGAIYIGIDGPGENGQWGAPSSPYLRGHIYKSGANHFRIVHPVDTNKFLLHTGIESPLTELLYRGKTQLSHGVAYVNLNTHYGLIPHTLDSILTNLTVCVYNNSSWTRVRCPLVSGVSFAIEAETTNCNDTVEWIAIGKRVGENVSDDIELGE